MRSQLSPSHRAGSVRVLFVNLSMLSMLAGALSFAACGGQQKNGIDNPASGVNVSKTDFGAQFDRSRCDDKGKQVVTLDANGDGKPDVIKLFQGATQDGHSTQQLLCKQTDLDFDGKIDLVDFSIMAYYWTG